jgi:hypothetical protein
MMGWVVGVAGALILLSAGIHLAAEFIDSVKTGNPWPIGALGYHGGLLVAGILTAVVGHMLCQSGESN